MIQTKKLMGMLGFVFALMFAGCATIEIPQTPPTGAVVQEAVMKDGVQKITLSWGRLNYNPEVMKFKLGVPARIEADTKRLTGCYRVLEIPQLKLEKQFTERDKVLEFTPQKTGTFPFGCAMGMGGGTIIVE